MSWVDDMNKAMDENPEQFGMVLDDHANPVERDPGYPFSFELDINVPEAP